eukprot:3029370-Pyramimonas_sp.AAC.1
MFRMCSPTQYNVSWPHIELHPRSPVAVSACVSPRRTALHGPIWSSTEGYSGRVRARLLHP